MAFDYFHCYNSYLKKCEKLSDQELGRLFRALLKYNSGGERPELAGRESIAFDFIADDIDRAKESYDNQCRQNAENGRKGGRPVQKPEAFEKTEGFLKNRPVILETEKSQDKGKDEDEDEDKRKNEDDSVLKTKPKRDGVFVEFAGDDSELLKALAGFEEMRSAIKKPLTDRARSGIIAELKKISPDRGDWITMLDNSTRHCWQSVYPDRSLKGRFAQAGPSQGRDDTERLKKRLGMQREAANEG